MKKWYPELYHTSLCELNTKNYNQINSQSFNISFSLFSRLIPLSSKNNIPEDFERDVNSTLLQQIPQQEQISISSKKYNSKKKSNKFCFPFLSSISFVQFPFKNLMQKISSIIGKNSEEFGKIPFRCFFGSILLSLFYVLFIFYPIQSIPISVLFFHKTNLLFYLNIFGQIFMWFSFFITHFTGHFPFLTSGLSYSSYSPIVPNICNEQYSSALQSIFKYYSSLPLKSSSSSSKSKLESFLHTHPTSVCHYCRIHLPLRAVHCKEINTCLMTFDHYCYFIWSPIYRQNYFYFYMYLIAMVFYIPLFNYTSILYLHNSQSKSKILAYFIIWCFIQWVFVLSLLYYMTQSIGMRETTFERIKKPFYLKENNLFNQGTWLQNLLQYYKEMYSYTIDNKYNNRIELRNNCQVYFDRDEIILKS